MIGSSPSTDICCQCQHYKCVCVSVSHRTTLCYCFGCKADVIGASGNVGVESVSHSEILPVCVCVSTVAAACVSAHKDRSCISTAPLACARGTCACVFGWFGAAKFTNSIKSNCDVFRQLLTPVVQMGKAIN